MKLPASLLAALVFAMPVAALTGGCTGEDPSQTATIPEHVNRPALGLMTTLPIFWAEGDDFGAMLSADAETHWALDVLAETHEVEPVDTLTSGALAPLGLLVLAQPRMLSPEENLVLDDWVRGGGHVLVFADPMLTGHSQYGFGDKRRPQDVALLDTILARWGLTLQAETPRAETAFVELGGGELPLEAEGAFVQREPAGGAQSRCTYRLGQVLVSCEIGKGTAVLLADAAVLEAHEKPGNSVIAALREIVSLAGNADADTAARNSGISGE